MTIEGKAVLVTGANRGIGRALVEEALSRGANRVYAGTRHPFAHPDERVIPLMLDVTNTAQIEAAVETIESLDMLINNAGVALYDDLSDRSVLEQHLAVNLFGTYGVTQAFLPMLIRSGGTIVNNVSMMAMAPCQKETRTMNDFNTSFVVDQSPEEVFEAINNVRGWWGEDVEGSHASVGDEFTYRVQDVHYSKLRVIERIRNEKVVWLVLENHMNHVEDQTEWVGSTISFDIAEKGDQTEVRFAHLGLLPQFECFDVCSNAWGSLMGSSLPSLIATGTGHPYK